MDFNVTVGGTADMEVYYENGLFLSFSACTGGLCNGVFEPSKILSVKATATGLRGFIL